MDHKTFTELIEKINQYTTVKNKIEMTWGTRKCRELLDDLWLDSRCDVVPRQGFNFDALMAIEELLELHDKIFPQFIKSSDTWEQR